MSSPVRRRWSRGALGLACAGATLGTLLDAIHTQSHVTAYTRPLVLDTAWWVPVLFAGAFAIGLIRPILDRGPSPTTRAMLGGMAAFAIAYGVSVLPLSWPIVSGLLLVIFAFTYLAFDGSRIGLAVAIGAAFGGPAVEVLLVAMGTFRHTVPVIAGVSGWLPFLYLTAAIALQNLGKWLVDGPRGRALNPQRSPPRSSAASPTA